MTSLAQLETLVNLHDGRKDGGQGILESDWQAARELIETEKSKPELSYAQESTVLAALRFFQDHIRESGKDSVSHMSHFDDVEPLTVSQIDDLCSQLNGSDSIHRIKRKRLKLPDPMKLYMASMGKIFRVTHICLNSDEANAFLEKNKDIACIAEDNNGLVYLAEQYGSIAPSQILNDLVKKD